MKFAFSLMTSWPPGAWLAQGAADDSVVHVQHGASVAAHGDWFGEIVWDGDYDLAGFDQTDIVYGTGGKIIDGQARFVTSSTTMDRLLSVQGRGGWWVSNSLACLAAATNQEFDALYGGYRSFFASVVQGKDRYLRRLPQSDPAIRLSYIDQLHIDAGQVTEVAAPIKPSRTADYASYVAFLEDRLSLVAKNMRAPSRPFAYDFLGTISTGFDSPTVAAIARSAGLEEVLTFTSARGGAGDDGSLIAERLGLRTYVCDRHAWQANRLAEPAFLAADAKGEDVYVAGAKEHLHRKVLLTGYAAGAWAAAPHANPNLCRADQSGLSLAEYRLEADFLHLPVPLLGAQGLSEDDLQAISQELRPWASGKSYDKPFCRRVLTEAGVPADLFGQEKKAASVLVFDRRSLLSEQSKGLFFAELSKARRQRPFAGLQRASRDIAKRGLTSLAQAARYLAGRLHTRLKIRLLERVAKSDRLKELAYYEPLSEYLFPWAMHHATMRYHTSSAPEVQQLDEHKPNSRAAKHSAEE